MLIGRLETNFSGHLIEISIFSFMKMHLKISSGKWQPFCLVLDMLIYVMKNVGNIDQHQIKAQTKCMTLGWKCISYEEVECVVRLYDFTYM